MATGRTQTPTLINLPPPPQDPMTPSDAPGTPNSTTTSMSELSTVAIKDGHRGHLHHSHHAPMDAERADRISRLAGLDRLGQSPRTLTPSNAGSTATAGGQPPQHPLATAYFDANNNPQMLRERSTVGSASATGSVGGRTTWASGSDVMEDKMSEDANMADMDTSSMGGFSDEGAASLVGFGEGARTPARPLNAVTSPPTAVGAPTMPKAPTGLRGQVGSQTPQSAIEAQKQDAKMIDGMTYDRDVVDTANRTPPPADEQGKEGGA